VDGIANTVTVTISNLSIFALFEQGVIIEPPEFVDTTPPAFTVTLTKEPNKTDVLTITAESSELLIEPPVARVLPHGNLNRTKKQPVDVPLIPSEENSTVFVGTFTGITGFGDVACIFVTGTDITGNEGISDGSFTRLLITSSGTVVLGTSGGKCSPGNSSATSAKLVSKSKGGTVKHSKAHKVFIPPVALSSDTVISITEVVSDTETVRKQERSLKKIVLKAIGIQIAFGPEGTQFEKPVTITIAFDTASVLNVDGLKLLIAYWNPDTSEWEPLLSVVDEGNHTVSAEVNHFSLYQILAREPPTVLSATVVDGTFRLGEVYSFPNPAVGGNKPTIHIECGIADSVEIKIYDIAGDFIHQTRLEQQPQVVNDGQGPQYAYEYTWDTSGIASGVYIYVVVAKKNGETDLRVMKKLAIIK